MKHISYLLPAFWLSFLILSCGESSEFAGLNGSSAEPAEDDPVNVVDPDQANGEDPDPSQADPNTADATDPTDSSDPNQASTPGDGDSPDDDRFVEETEFFLTESVRDQLDLVWVLDSSASMNDEREAVLENLSKFIEDVQQTSNLRVIFLGPSDFVGALPSSDKVYYKVARVDSFGPLRFLAASLCDPSGNRAIAPSAYDIKGDPTFFKGKVCGEEVSTSNADESDKYLKYGSLDKRIEENISIVEFLRPEAQKMAVFVTDDNARVVNYDMFKNLSSKFTNFSNPIFHAFIESDTGSLGSGEEVGEEYVKMAEKTGGSIWDIDVNWVENFKNLTDTVKKVYSKPMKLKYKAKKILKVFVGDKELSESNWVLRSDNTVVLTGVDFGQSDVEIKIEYSRLD